MEKRGMTRAQSRSIRRGIQKGAYLTRQLMVSLYRFNDERIRLRTTRGVSGPSLLRWFCGNRLAGGKREYPIPTIALLNRLPLDERGRRPHLTKEILEAAHAEGWIILGEKWLFPEKVMKFIAGTFPKAVEAAAYARSLGSGVVGKGLFELKEGDITLKDITSYNSKGETIHARCDGSGRIHPDHPIFSRLGMICPIQIRIWNPDKGVFLKGILIPDERCLDKMGQPTIWIDWEQVKGAWKLLAKERMGINTKAFDKKGILINSEKLVESITGEGYFLAVLQVWDKPGDIRWCFEVLEKVQDSEQNRKWVSQWIREALRDLQLEGGFNKILLALAEDNAKMALLLQFCRILEIDPIQIPFIASLVGEQMSRFLWHLRNGAGKVSRRYVSVLDAGIPEGWAVLADDSRKDKSIEWEHSEEIAVTRFPMVLAQNLRVLKVLDPRVEGWEHLRHLLIKTHRGERVPKNTIYMNPKDLTGRLQGDDDGDIVLVSEDTRAIEMFRNKLPMMGTDASRVFLIEPGERTGGARGEVPLVTRDDKVPRAALPILGLDGRGPVGQLTFYSAFFLALGKPLHALATAVCVQEAIDGAKKDIMLSDPSKLVIPGNWEEKDGCWSPKPNTKANERWYGEDGHLNMKIFAWWASKETGGLKMKDILCWRSDKGKASDTEWVGEYPAVGGNLVHFCNKEAFRLWDAYRKAKLKDREEINLNTVLFKALERITGLEWAITPVEDYTDTEYQELLGKSGLINFGRTMSDIIKEYESDANDEDSTRNLTREDRNLKIDALLEILASQLRALSIDELLVLWTTEMAESERNPQYRERHINRAFRAISFSGSPILKELGIDMPIPCEYLQDIPNVFENLVELVKNKHELDIFHAITGWLQEDELHELATDKPACNCDDCRKLLEALAISLVRKHNENIQGDYKREIARVIHGINAQLRGVGSNGIPLIHNEEAPEDE